MAQTQEQSFKQLDNLMVSYLSHVANVERIEQLDTKDELAQRQIWAGLAGQLRVPFEHILDYWNQKSEHSKKELWKRVLKMRIESVAAHPAFRAQTMSRVAGKALDKLEYLMDSGLIRSPAELMAIARLAAPAQSPGGQNAGVVVNFNGGGGAMTLASGQSLPGGEGVMTLQLSPRSRVGEQRKEPGADSRVIDAAMVTASALRDINLDSSVEINESEPDIKAARAQFDPLADVDALGVVLDSIEVIDLNE